MPEFRSAQAGDRAILAKMYMDEIEQSEERADRFADDLIHKMNTILCFENSMICGTVSWSVRGGREDGVVEIVSLGVNKDHRRKGFATALMQEAIDDAQDFLSEKGGRLRTIFLFMESSNEVARAFYESLHFKEVVAIPSFYPDDAASIFVRRFEGV